MNIREVLDPMNEKISDLPELGKFRTLYLDFAKAMLEMTNKQFVDRGADKTLIQELPASPTKPIQ